MVSRISVQFMAGVAGLEPTNGGIKTRCLTNLAIPQWIHECDSREMAGVAGLEPTNGGIKTRCLTNLAIPQQMVRKERLELSRREALEPKSSVSTNSTTPAFLWSFYKK